MRLRLIHASTTLTFAFACFGLWAMLNLLSTVSGRAQPLPAFSALIVGLRWWLLVLPIPVAAYSLYTIVRRHSTDHNALGFMAVTITTFSFVLFPVLLALFLPCVLLMDLSWKQAGL